MDGAKPVFHPTIGREGETATLLFGLSVSLSLRGGGFAPRHLKRSAAILFLLPPQCRRVNKWHKLSRKSCCGYLL